MRKKFGEYHPMILIKKLRIIFILIISYIFQYLYSPDKTGFSLKQYQSSVLPEIIDFENNLNLNLTIFDEFRNINSKNVLIEQNHKFKKSYNPDISIIITMYNQAHCLYKGLRSIQNQSIKNIEIIIIDDCS